jgi:hypothetical protein
MSMVPVSAGDGVTLKKPHPCGGFDWTVTRTGADIGLVCAGCGRRVMLTRDEFERRVKNVVRSASTVEAGSAALAREASC